VSTSGSVKVFENSVTCVMFFQLAGLVSLLLCSKTSRLLKAIFGHGNIAVHIVNISIENPYLQKKT
jgi:hypothetical protein